ncbi:MAG: hypothetical protein QW506_03270 [Thermoproteota archaeon]
MRLRVLLVAGILILSAFSGCTFKAEELEETIIVTASYYPRYHLVDGKWPDGITGTPLLGLYESEDWKPSASTRVGRALGVIIITIGLAGWLFVKHKRKPNR